MRTALSVVLTDWPPGPGRAIDVDPQILVVDLDVDILGLGQHRDGRRRGVDAPAALGHRHALDAVDAAFELQPGEHALAVDRGDRFLVAAELGRRSPRSARPASPALRHSAGTCATGRRRTAPPRRRRCRRGSRASPARSSAASRGSSLQRQRALGLRAACARISSASSRRHLLELGLGRRVVRPCRRARRARRAAAALRAPRRRPARSRHNPWTAATNSSGAQVAARHRLLQARACRASIDAIRSGEMRVIGRAPRPSGRARRARCSPLAEDS